MHPRRAARSDSCGHRLRLNVAQDSRMKQEDQRVGTGVLANELLQ